ncbi:MAG: hypothetical protein U0936_20635 [Planctomycetaceae bacterium]
MSNWSMPEGKPVTDDARKLLGVKELSVVVAEGTARRDESGNLTVAAKDLCSTGEIIMIDSSLDLRQLAVDRTPAPTGVIPRRRRWISRFVIPGVILTGFASLLAVAAGMQFLPVPQVTVVPVITIRGDVQQAGTVLFQAPGWIEPRPTSIRAAALTSGVVEELLVVDGEEVRKGETVA